MRMIPVEDLEKITNIQGMSVSELLYDIVIHTMPSKYTNGNTNNVIDTSIDIYNTLKNNGIVQIHDFDEDDLDIAQEIYDEFIEEK